MEELLVLLQPPQTPARGQAAQRQEQAYEWLGVVKLLQHRTNDEVVASPARAQDQIHKMAPLLAPAQADPHSQAAHTCERLLKELSEANRAIFHRSPALREKVRAACAFQLRKPRVICLSRSSRSTDAEDLRTHTASPQHMC